MKPSPPAFSISNLKKTMKMTWHFVISAVWAGTVFSPRLWTALTAQAAADAGWFKPWFSITIHCDCQKIRTVFRVLGMYNFEAPFDFSYQIRNGCIRAARRMFYVPLKLSDKSGQTTLCNFSLNISFFPITLYFHIEILAFTLPLHPKCWAIFSMNSINIYNF